MMKFFFLTFCFWLRVLLLCANQHEEQPLKELIADLEKQLPYVSRDDQGLYQKELAIAYYKDQNLYDAFHAFLKALERSKELQSTLPGQEEDELYKAALKIYLNSRLSPHEASEMLKNRYANVMHEHPSYYRLGYLVAMAYANLSQFDRFFNLFYASYQRLPDHFLAFKAKAILHAKLYERAKTPQEKEVERELILRNLEKAKKIYPQDISLYKMEIVFSENSAQDDMIAKNVKELIKGNYIIPRTELPFYFDGLFAHGHIELAQELTKKAREWYPFSRTLDSAEEFINQKQSLKE